MTFPILQMAPVRGISDLVYRNSYKDHFSGIDEAVSPFVTTVKGDQLKDSQRQQLERSKNKLPVIPQVIGKNADHFIELSRIFEEQGHTAVNWNLGCPHPTMTRKKCGSGLLQYPDIIDRFLEKVCNNISLSISVKVRLGLESPGELMNLLPILNRYPLYEVIIHPRLGKQMYKGSVDLDSFEQLIPHCTHKIVYNGDIFTLADFEKISSRFPMIDHFMLGRGLFMNPFLADQIKCRTCLVEKERLMRFHDSLFREYAEILSGPAHIIQRMSGHWEYLHHSFENGKKAYREIKKAKTLDDYYRGISLLK